MEPIIIKEFIFNTTAIVLVLGFFYWLMIYLSKPTKRIQDYARQQFIIEQMSFERSYTNHILRDYKPTFPSLYYSYERDMTDAELKKWHEENRMKREPIVFKWDDVFRINPDAFRIGDMTLNDGVWYEHNGKEWEIKYKS